MTNLVPGTKFVIVAQGSDFMRIMNVIRAIIIFLMIGIVVVVAGCARWPDGPGPGPVEPEYQLEITVEVAGVINSSEGIYYIVLDADEESIDGPGDDLFFWDDDFYYVKLDGVGFHFAQVKDDFESIFDGEIFSENELQVTIALSDLGSPSSIDINVITTDSDNNTYDYLDPYFTIGTDLGSSENITDTEGDSGEGGADFDIINVAAEITTPY
ncbi:hypothetical protein ES705_27876 [subsurface metagenome]